jgi:hypothetical protein
MRLNYYGVKPYYYRLRLRLRVLKPDCSAAWKNFCGRDSHDCGARSGFFGAKFYFLRREKNVSLAEDSIPRR